MSTADRLIAALRALLAEFRSPENRFWLTDACADRLEAVLIENAQRREEVMPDGERQRSQPADNHEPDKSGEGGAFVITPLPEVPRTVSLHLSCLPANLRELKRGLEIGMFGPPVPLGRGPEQQPWVNACMALVTTENAIAAVEYLQLLLDELLATASRGGGDTRPPRADHDSTSTNEPELPQ